MIDVFNAAAAVEAPILMQVGGEHRMAGVVLQRRRGGPVAPALVASTCKLVQEAQDVTWNIEGHFADADASSCAPSGASALATVAAGYRCSTVFVVTMTSR